MTDVEEVGDAARQEGARPASEGRNEEKSAFQFSHFEKLLSSPQEAEEGREGVGEAADPLHDLGDDDLVTVRARELHRVLAQQLHGHNEAAAAVTAESTAAAT